MKRVLIALVAAAWCGAGAMAQETACKPPVMGWSSWNAFRVNISEEIIKRQADLMVEKGLKDAGYTFVNIDDGFFGERDETGKMHEHARRFPNGMKAVVDYIHGLGLSAGIYTDAGNNTCGSMSDGEKSGVGAGIYGHEAQDARLYFGDWGFDFIKIDYCGGNDLGLEERARYTEIRQHIDAVRKGVALNICRWAFPGTWAKEIAGSWRISGDIQASWESVRYVVGKNLYLSAYAGGGHYNDMDMMVVGFNESSPVGGEGLSPNEEEAHFGLWCIMSSPLLIGCDLDKISDASLQLLKNEELLALNRDPLGLQACVVQHENEGYVLAKDIERRRGNVRAVALYNPSDAPCSFSVPLSVLELEGTARVRDLARRKDLGKAKGALAWEVPARSAMILRVEGEKRVEPTRYEAEWAYLPLFDDLGRNAKGIRYLPVEGASGQMAVGFLGGRPENCAEWKEVYSETGGEYEMAIRYAQGAGRQLEVTVNGETRIVPRLEQGAGFHTVVVPVVLKSGYNDIRLGNSYNWAPDIDCFDLTKK